MKQVSPEYQKTIQLHRTQGFRNTMHAKINFGLIDQYAMSDATFTISPGVSFSDTSGITSGVNNVTGGYEMCIRDSLSTAGISVQYAIEKSAGTRPTTGYTPLTGITTIPDLNPEPSSLETTTLDELEWRTYIPVSYTHLSILNEMLGLHCKNVLEEDFLFWYRRGMQPILERRKTVRPEINNKITENHAAEIVAFKNCLLYTSINLLIASLVV